MTLDLQSNVAEDDTSELSNCPLSDASCHQCVTPGVSHPVILHEHVGGLVVYKQLLCIHYIVTKCIQESKWCSFEQCATE